MLNNIIAIIFRLINFSIIVAGSVYLFQKYILSSIKERIKEKEIFWQNLRINKESLIDQKDRIITQIASQETYAQYLLNNIVKWQKYIQQKELQKIEQQKNISIHIAQRIDQQEQNYSLELLKQELLPDVFDKAYDELKKKYQSPIEAQEYIDKVLNQIGK
ncbi:MAG: hypothetical protein WDZ41_02125 [Candidatus Babeliales bacterium]